MRQAPNAFRREKPLMLWRRHQPPIPPCEACVKGGKIACGDDNDSARIQSLPAEGQDAPRICQMFDDIEHYYDVDHAELSESGLLGNSVNYAKPAVAAKRNRRLRDFKSGHIIKAARFVQKEAVGASDLQKASAFMKTANEFHRAGEFASQDRLAAEIVGVTVTTLPGEIFCGVVSMNVETAITFGPAQAALRALQNVAGIFRK
jgi:hypothetical protein